MGLLVWFVMILWNVMAAIFGGIAKATQPVTGWEEEDNGSVVDASPLAVVLENPDNEWAWTQGIVGTMAATAGKAIGRAGKKKMEGIPEDFMNL